MDLLVSRGSLGLLDLADHDLRDLGPGRTRAVGGEEQQGTGGDRTELDVDVLAIELVEMHGVSFR